MSFMNEIFYVWMKHPVVEKILRILYPRRCPVCQRIVYPIGESICPGCREEIAFVKSPTCRCCGKPVISWEAELCYDCTRHRRPFYGGVSLMLYDDVGRVTMKAFKFQGRQEYAAYYIEETWNRYADSIASFQADLILPVPIHASKRRVRGYNQAELLAMELSLRSGIPMQSDLLVRYRKTIAQKKLDAGERQRNLEAALRVEGSCEGIQRVILVDDIYTTGSTLAACSRVLYAAGIQEIFIVTICIGENM